MPVEMIHKLCQHFKAGKETIGDERCAGCSIEMHTDENIHRVEKLILQVG